MFCKNCGEYIRGKSSYCPRCKNLLIYSRKNDLDEELTNELYSKGDKSELGSNFISFICPIIGVILYFLNKHYMPRKSHSIMGSLIFGCIVWCAVGIFLNVIYGMNMDIFSSMQDMLVGTL